MPTQEERLSGGLYGLLIGDALGVPYEFHAAEALPPQGQIEFDPPAGFHRSHSSVAPGTWSDDGAQALCLLASLLDCGALDVEDLGERLARWAEAGYCAVDDYVFDIGITTSAALRNLRHGKPAEMAGPSDEYSNGNGSLMRVLPLALWHRGSDEELAHDAMLQSRVTHGHLRSQLCCALYCLWARRILQEHAAPWPEAVATLRHIIADDEKVQGELEFHIRPDEAPGGQGSGYVVDCLRSARWSVEQGSYETAVKSAVALGKDTDTTACVAGGIAGLRDGAAAIPERWKTRLRGQNIALPLLQGLLARV